MSPKVTEKYRQSVRDKILRSAENLFSHKGYHETSMDDIVRESGLSKGAIYGYFESKQDLFLALSERRVASIMDTIQSGFSPNDSALKKLEKAGEFHFNYIEQSIEICRMSLECWVEAPRIASLQKRLDNRYEKAHRFIAEIIKEGIQKGEFRKDIDPDAVSSFLLATIDGLLLHRATTNQNINWQKIKNIILTILGEGILEYKTGLKTD